jgi:hypothetical protein
MKIRRTKNRRIIDFCHRDLWVSYAESSLTNYLLNLYCIAQINYKSDNNLYFYSLFEYLDTE